MPLNDWDRLNQRIVGQRLNWLGIRDELLGIIERLDSLRRQGKIEEGKYRQKGNYFKNTVIALVKSFCGIELKDRKIRGKTDVHDVDISHISGVGNLFGGSAVLVAGEVKMMGSPSHIRGGAEYPERTISIDIDKRSKEVKYTPVDLKRLNSPDIVGGWDKWIESSKPAFFSAWLMRLAVKNKLKHVRDKIEGMAEYNNGVGLAIFKEESNHYKWVEIKSENPKVFSIQQLVEKICSHIS